MWEFGGVLANRRSLQTLTLPALFERASKIIAGDWGIVWIVTTGTELLGWIAGAVQNSSRLVGVR